MKILLINPKTRTSMYTFTEVSDITGFPGCMPNLALPTLAALTPSDIEVTCVDEGVETIDFDQKWDLVGITGYITHRKRMFEIADEFRSRGQLVAIGGPYASLSPGAVKPHADILFIGEAENTWPTFLEDFRAGTWKDQYVSLGSVDIKSSPVPDISILKPHGYFMGMVQTSRGCPFECEFCDVIILLGRNQRHKTPERVVEEIEQFYDKGYRAIFLSDDNFTANRKRAAAIMAAVGEWNRSKPEPVSFTTQLSIDVARDQDVPLLDLCAEAGLTSAFIGIETPNTDALKDVKKRQNLRGDLVADVHRLQQHGIMVQAGMITGFDTDTVESFRRQYEFVQEAGIPMVSLSMLNAPEGTPFEHRLIKEGRLIKEVDDAYLETNILPKGMTSGEWRQGHIWLLNKMYSPTAFMERVSVLAANLAPARVCYRPNRQAYEVVDRLLLSYSKLPPEFRKIPYECISMFRKKDGAVLLTALLFYKHVLAFMRKFDLWDPALALLDGPDFNQGIEHVGSEASWDSR